mmetsp:Transcript_38318/g.60524  ORF Transcript_38318/g.60524 Transcript_38318/m.60524 type:complete len:247 (-) Transcript_38318:129-869(-)
MGTRFARFQAAEGQVPPVPPGDVEGESKVELKGDPFEIRLISLTGDEKLVSVEPSSSIADLQKLAAEALNWEKPWCINFAQGSSVIATSPETTLQELGFVENCELMVLRREPWCRQNLGCSRYNNNYACHIRELREVGPAELELDFSAEGDNSLGPLQKAERSVLVWEAGATDALRVDPQRRRDRPCLRTARGRVNFTVETKRLKEGTMTFSNVPTSGRVSFIFGEGGYSQLTMTLGPEEENEAKS